MLSTYLQIKNHYDELTKAEKRVAKYCLDNYMNMANCTLAHLSKLSGSGEATTLRFCKKIGFESYASFRHEVNQELQESNMLQENSIGAEIKSNINQLFDFVMQNLDPELLKEVATLICHADKIFCVGVGNSGIPAEACAMRLVRNGKNGIFIKDTHFQNIYINELTKKDVAILFSYSGQSKDVIHCAELLKQRKIPVVAITSSVVSGLAQLSDYHFLIQQNHRGPLSSGSMIGQIVQLYVADIILTQAAMLEPKKTLKARNMTYEYILDKVDVPDLSSDEN